MVNRGYREFVIDLQNCAMMDSTFMGTMAGVALRLKELGHGHLHVVHCGDRSRELLSGLGLDQIFSIYSNGSESPECQQLQRGATLWISKKCNRRARCSRRTKRCAKQRRKIFSGSRTFSIT